MISDRRKSLTAGAVRAIFVEPAHQGGFEVDSGLMPS